MKFYLGIHNPAWVNISKVPVFISMSRLWSRRKVFDHSCEVGIDSGGFSQLKLNGEWTVTPDEYLTKLDELSAEFVAALFAFHEASKDALRIVCDYMREESPEIRLSQDNSEVMFG